MLINELTSSISQNMYDLLVELFPICRSITGDGTRETLQKIKKHIPINIYEIPTGTKAFDWTVPKEWNIRDAYILDNKGNKVVDFKRNNLHVMGYSIPICKHFSLSELQPHLYSLKEQPDAIPYITSYYKEHWGFCISEKQRNQLQDGDYYAFIDSDLKDGSLTYGELIIPGHTEKEVFLSTYICHPSMANNELSGPVVTTFLAKWIMSTPRKYTYRIVFVPETIGSICYISKNRETLKKNVIAGFNVTCVGDERAYSFLSSRKGGTLADRVALNVLKFKHPEFIRYSFLDRGRDERQYCSSGIDLPMVSLMRSKYGEYPEYHTSLDNPDLVTPNGLGGSLELLQDCIELIESNHIYCVACYCEPQLGSRGLYPNLSTKNSGKSVKSMMDFIAYCDGTSDLIEISDKIHVPSSELYPIIKKLEEINLLSKSNNKNN